MKFLDIKNPGELQYWLSSKSEDEELVERFEQTLMRILMSIQGDYEWSFTKGHFIHDDGRAEFVACAYFSIDKTYRPGFLFSIDDMESVRDFWIKDPSLHLEETPTYH